jgi:aminoglycoside 6-adenylyltransferase
MSGPGAYPPAVLSLPTEAEVLARLVAWGEGRDDVRALVLTSSRARPDGPADVLSDYDVILFVADADAFARRDEWQSDYGPRFGWWSDEGALRGLATFFRGVVYEDGVKVDWSIWPAELLERVAAEPELPDVLDVGYRVLLDKDGRTAGWPPPTFHAHIPAKPTSAGYEALVAEFWWTTTYVAKALWRGEIVFAKWVLENDAKIGALRRLLEWRIEIDHDWSLRPGAYGRGLERLLPGDVWSELAATYVGTEVEDNWDALFGVSALVRRIATEVGEALGYRYPQELDDAAAEHVRTVRALPR